MKQVFLPFMLCLCMGNAMISFSQSALRSNDIAAIYQMVERNMNAGNYESALHELKRNAGDNVNRNDSLLYLRVKILEGLYRKNNQYTVEMEESIQQFISKVNRYSFPEIKYAEVASIQSNFLYFKEKDKNFFDSASRIQLSEKPEHLASIEARLAEYLKSTPNSYHFQQLTAKQASIEKKRKKLENDKINHEILKRVGKSNVFTAGISVISSQLPFAGLRDFTDAKAVFDGSGKNSLGLKYSLNASLATVLFNIYTGNRVKAGIIWNIFDAEYTVFDWAKDTLLRKGSEGRIRELRSIKAGTRIGPMVTVLLTRKIAVSAYYQARPGVMFLLDQFSFSENSGNGTTTYSMTPKYQNYNLSNEVGLRFYFFKRLFINPFIHFGNFNWQNDVDEGSSKFTWKANYSFNFTGIRIGI